MNKKICGCKVGSNGIYLLRKWRAAVSGAGWPATGKGWEVFGDQEQGGVRGWPARCNPPPMGDGMGWAGSRGDCLASMRPADALAFPCGAGCG